MFRVPSRKTKHETRSTLRFTYRLAFFSEVADEGDDGRTLVRHIPYIREIWRPQIAPWAIRGCCFDVIIRHSLTR